MYSSCRGEIVAAFDALEADLAAALADRLRITRADASRRIGEAAELGDRTAITGEPLPPLLTATAAAQQDGRIGSAHVAVIRGFVHRLPDFVDLETRVQAEAQLAGLGGQHETSPTTTGPADGVSPSATKASTG